MCINTEAAHSAPRRMAKLTEGGGCALLRLAVENFFLRFFLLRMEKMHPPRTLMNCSTMLRRASSSSTYAARCLRSFSTSLPPPPPPPRSPARDGVVIPSGSVAVPRASKYMPGFSFPAPRKLETIVKYALLEREQPAEVERICACFFCCRCAAAGCWVRTGGPSAHPGRAATFR